MSRPTEGSTRLAVGCRVACGRLLVHTALHSALTICFAELTVAPPASLSCLHLTSYRHPALACFPPSPSLPFSSLPCRRLALSTNQIDRMGPFTGMEKLRLLSMGRNALRKIERLEDVAGTLEELWLSYNMIASLDGLAACQNLQVLYMANNAVRQRMREVTILIDRCM